MFVRIHSLVTSVLTGRSPLTVFCISLSLLLLLGWVDYLTGDYSLIIFYLVPVSFVAWFISRSSGVCFSILTLATRYIAERLTVPSLGSSTLHYWNQFIEFLFLLIMVFLFSALKKNLDQEKLLARTDHLTGALNRRSFFDLADHELNRSRRYGKPLTAAYIDLDNFKEINDQLGHHTGDELLIFVVSTIKSNIRSTDVLARFGGDEFILLLPDTNFEAAQSFFTKIQARLMDTMRQRQWPVTYSIGAVTYTAPPESIDELIHRADELMYSVKRSGKDRLLHIVVEEETHG